MQTQDAPAEFIVKLWPWLEANKNRLIMIGLAIVAGWGVFSFISWQHEQKEISAGQALTHLLLTPPVGDDAKAIAAAYTQVADQYPGTVAGKRAQLQAAAALFDAGRYADAQALFEKSLAADATGPLAATAQLGVAASLEAQDKLDTAAEVYQRVASVFRNSPAALTAKLSLGRIAEQQGKLSDALSEYEDVARSVAGGPLASEAAMHAIAVKTRLAAMPKPAASNSVTATKPGTPATK
jgi:predicted negative regulator of RcsB-dependent stress response